MDLKWFEKIEDYVHGRMSSEEQLLFESEMAKDSELQSIVKIYEVIESEMKRELAYSGSESSLKKTLEELNLRYFKNEPQQVPGETTLQDNSEIQDASSELRKTEPVKEDKGIVRRMTSIRKLSIAAAILAIVALSTFYLLRKQENIQITAKRKGADTVTANTETTNDKKYKPDIDIAKVNRDTSSLLPKKKPAGIPEPEAAILYASNFQPDKTPEDKEGPLEEAFLAYDSKNYKTAIAAIDNADINIETRGEETDQKLTKFYANYYKAQSYLAGNEIIKAIPALEMAIAVSPDSLSRIKAEWYLALASMKRGDSEKTNKLLKRVANNSVETHFKTKAQLLSIKLESK